MVQPTENETAPLATENIVNGILSRVTFLSRLQKETTLVSKEPDRYVRLLKNGYALANIVQVNDTFYNLLHGSLKAPCQTGFAENDSFLKTPCPTHDVM